MIKGAVENLTMFAIVVDKVMRYEPGLTGAVSFSLLELCDTPTIYKLLDLGFIYFSFDRVFK